MFLTTSLFDQPFIMTTHTDDDHDNTTPTSTAPAITKDLKKAPLEARNIDTMAVSLPAQADILCGKDKTYAKHAGNQRFRQCIQDYVGAYQAASNKQEKMTITKEIVRTLQTVHNARFLKKSSNDNDNDDDDDDGADSWLEISNQNARDKTSHALRFAANKKGNIGVSSQSRSAKKKHRRHVSADSASGSSLSDDFSSNSSHHSVTAVTSVAASAAASAVEQPAHGASNVAVVQTLFERQQAILVQLRKDLEANTDAKQNSTGSAPVAVAAAVAVETTSSMTHHVEPEHDNFNTLRSEDLDRLMSEPLDEGEWDNVLQLTR